MINKDCYVVQPFIGVINGATIEVPYPEMYTAINKLVRYLTLHTSGCYGGIKLTFDEKKEIAEIVRDVAYIVKNNEEEISWVEWLRENSIGLTWYKGGDEQILSNFKFVLACETELFEKETERMQRILADIKRRYINNKEV